MEQLSNKKSTKINGNAIRAWGFLFLAAGVIGRGVIQTHILQLGNMSAQQLLEVMGSSESVMTLVTASLVLQAVETCAVPIFVLLLVEGVRHTSDLKAYMLRVAGVAVLSEIPYNLAMSGKLLAFDSRNPVFGMLLCQVMLWFFRQYAGNSLKHVLIKALVIVAAVIWCQMLGVEFGACLVLIAAVLWALRDKAVYRNLAGTTVAIVCSAISPFFLAAPMGFMAVHFYDGEKSTNSRKVNYLAYPVMLLIAALVGMLL